MVRAKDRHGTADAQTVRRRSVYYPSGDGKPLAESYVHAMTMYDILARLQHHYAGREDVHFGINSFIYYIEGDPTRRVAPDVYMVLGVPPRPLEARESYRLWEEGVPPAIVFELTSPKTRRNDLEGKRDIYAAMGVREYILFDPKRQYLRPALRGFNLAGAAYTEQPLEQDGSWHSGVLNARLVPADDRLDVFDFDTGERWLTAQEAAEQRADAAEAELRALRAQLDALRGGGANDAATP